MLLLKADNLKNYLLVATPQMHHSDFSESVIYLCQHNKKRGAMGFSLNQPIKNSSLHKILRHMGIDYDKSNLPDSCLLAGGPENPDSGFVIHSPAGKWRTSLVVNKQVGITASRDILEAIANGDQSFKKSVIAMGHSNWQPGQLEAQIQSNHWLVVPATPEILFNTPSESLWKAALSMTGVNHLANLSPYTGHA